jgi:hypothetical protein
MHVFGCVRYRSSKLSSYDWGGKGIVMSGTGTFTHGSV